MAVATGLLVCGLTAALVVQHHTITKLRLEARALGADLVRLKDDARPSPRPAAQADDQLGELLRLRSEIGLLASANRELSNKLARAATNVVPTTERPSPIANVGTATPAAATETFFWAIGNGDSDVLRQLLACRRDNSIPEKVVDKMLPQQVRAIMSLDKPTGVRVLGERELSPDSVRLRLEITDQTGKIRLREMEAVRAADGWRPVLQFERAPNSRSIGITLFLPPSAELGPYEESRAM